MEVKTPARRVQRFVDLAEAGDYFGPVPLLSNDKPVVQVCYFLLPIARDDDARPQARGIHSVQSPPHVFRECSDGSLEIRESIGAGRGDGQPGFYWHGYLDEGNVWRELV